MPKTNNFYTTREAARLLGISVRTAQQWIEKGILTGWKTEGGHRRISVKSVEAMQGRQIRQHSSKQQSSAALRILVVEDSQTLLKLYQHQLKAWPFPVEIYTVPNGFEALVMVGEVSPQLLVCDLRLPGVNGFQIVRALREIPRYKDLAIVVVSGLTLSEVQAHGGLPPQIELLGKPIDFSRLLSIAKSQLPTRYQVE
jgi:excisionase family DNA binding protein